MPPLEAFLSNLPVVPINLHLGFGLSKFFRTFILVSNSQLILRLGSRRAFILSIHSFASFFSIAVSSSQQGAKKSMLSRFTDRAHEHEVLIDCIDDNSDTFMDVGPAHCLIPLCSALLVPIRGKPATNRPLNRDISWQMSTVRATNSWTPLPKAADRGREALVESLLKREGVDANSKDKNGRTPPGRPRPTRAKQ